MRQDETNPYRHATLSELRQACNEAVGELEERSCRTREEREAFAGRRFLLLAVASLPHRSEAYQWLEPSLVLRSQRCGDIGTQDDEALARALQELEQLRKTPLSPIS